MSLSVLLDGRPLFDFSRFRGIGSFLRSLLDALSGDSELALSALVVPDVELPSGVRSRRIRRVMPNRFARREHEVLLPREIARAKPDVFWSPALDPPRRSPVPWVQTLHDVIPLVFDDVRYASERKRWREKLAPRIRTADAVVADSAHSASDAIHTLALDPDRVHVIHLGVDGRFGPPADDWTSRAGTPYLLFVGEYDPRKGYSEAFATITRLAQLGYPHELRVVGSIAPWVEPELKRELSSCGHPERVHLLGFVPFEELRELYWNASAMLVTSRYEGFGLPALEAMACGTPVVAFNNSATGEVINGGGSLVQDGDLDAMVAAVTQVLESPGERQRLKHAGLRRAQDFSWTRCAEGYASIFRSVAGGK